MATSQQVNLMTNVRGYFVGTKASIEATTGLGEGSLGYATDTDETGSYDGTVWTWGSGGFPNPFALTEDLTPATLTGDVNDYNPTGLSTSDVLRLNAGTNPRSITGIAGGADGRVLVIQNISDADDITLIYESTSSAEANRFKTNGDITIRPSRSAIIIYDATISRWRLLASGQADSLQGAPIAAGLASGLQNNDLIIYNLGDDNFERAAPADVVDLALGTIGTSLSEITDLTDGGATTLHSHAGGGGEAFPVGSVFISVVSTNPATLLGYGTWSAFGAGRVMVGLDAGQTEFDTVEETGGAKTHTLTSSEMPAHSHTQDAHSHTQNSHNHGQDAHNHSQNAHGHSIWSGQLYSGFTTGATGLAPNGGGGFSAIATGNTAATNNPTTATNQAATATNQNTTATNQNTGGGAAHNNLQPYIVCYFWKRTA